jgi:NTE family protein
VHVAKRALVMSGGGARGAFQVGAVDYLVAELGLDFDVIAGVSVGSMNAAFLAQARGPDELRQQLAALKEHWFSIPDHTAYYRKRFLGDVLVFVWNQAINDSRATGAQLARHINPDRLRFSGRMLRVGAVSLETGEYRTATEAEPAIRDWVFGSSSMPVFFPPVPVGGHHLVDGGIRNITPLKDAFAALGPGPADGTDEVYVVLASPLGIKSCAGTRWKNGRLIAERALAILINEIFREDLRFALDINDSVRAHEQITRLLRGRGPLSAEDEAALAQFRYRSPRYRCVDLKVIMPTQEFMEYLDLEPRKIRLAYDAGRQAAAAPLSAAALRAELRA